MSDNTVVEDLPPWNERVKFSDQGGGFAYVPNTAFVRQSASDVELDTVDFSTFAAEGETINVDDEPTSGFRRIVGNFDAIRVVAQLRAGGFAAQPDHVLFAHGTTCCCGPHPATPFDPCYMANPVHANPVHANPVHANPVHANSADPNGPSRSSARPANEPTWFPVSANAVAPARPSVVVLDTGLARDNDLPDLLSNAIGVTASAGSRDVPDRNGDLWLDPVAGHGTFIAGIIERIAPGCAIEIVRVLEPRGEGNESTIVATIDEIVQGQNPPAFLNLSFGGYVWEDAPMLSAAVLRAQQRGIVVVASAGNDGTCRPSYPAAIPGVVSVGAIGPDGPAWFSNYGSWVRACAPGVNVVSSFFKLFDGPEVRSAGRDIDSFASWATWSGTSFAAPAVIGALVLEIRRSGCTPTEAVEHVIDASWLGRIPGLGTVVNV